MSEVLIYQGKDNTIQIEVQFENETVWLTQKQLAELFNKNVMTINEHIKNIFNEQELEENSTIRKSLIVQQEGNREVSREVLFYNLDVIISVGYRVKSPQGTQFRIWATQRLKEYLIKGFTMNDERLKNIGGGNYWKELLDRIRDIRSSEKVMYRQVLDLYATAIDYNPKSDESIQFFKIVQNKLHFAAHGNTAAEVVYFRVGSDKPFAGLTHFKGSQPTQAEALIAKNYLQIEELKVLNNLVSAYFDLAEINAIEEKPMKMQDYIKQLDSILSSTGREILHNAGKISQLQAEEKAKTEFRKYHNKTLSEVEKSYLDTLKQLEKSIKKKK
ncbi:MAG: virulence RhuM family protein [Flavobacteriaceae bacterium]|nr:virulence RhuM family protein [Flavobacteriaceae bacterium]MDZ4148153.1 virulence RhuM family protein [Flavobacteriaceae bacterium]